jgi:hypothetical protein
MRAIRAAIGKTAAASAVAIVAVGSATASVAAAFSHAELTERIAVADKLEGRARAAFGQRYGCIVDPTSGRVQLLVTARSDARTAKRWVSRLGASRIALVRRISPQYGDVAMGRISAGLITDLGFYNPDVLVMSEPERSTTTTRCRTITVLLSDTAATWVRTVIDEQKVSWGDRVQLRVVPAADIPPPENRAKARSAE